MICLLRLKNYKLTELETGFPLIHKTVIARKKEEQMSLLIPFPQFPPASNSPLKEFPLWVIKLAFDLIMLQLNRVATVALAVSTRMNWTYFKATKNLSLGPSLLTWLGLDTLIFNEKSSIFLFSLVKEIPWKCLTIAETHQLVSQSYLLLAQEISPSPSCTYLQKRQKVTFFGTWIL